MDFRRCALCETLLSRPRLRAALDAISASVVGVILNLSLWFALHVLFDEIGTGRFGPVIDPATLSLPNAGLVVLAAILLILLRVQMIPALLVRGAISGALGAAGYFFV